MPTYFNSFGVLQISGRDAAQFLQGQISCDINEVDEEHSLLGTCCDRKGRVLFSFRIFQKAEAYYLYLPKSMLEFAIAHLRKFIIIAKVSLDIKAFHCRGFGAEELEEWLSLHPMKTPKKWGEVRSNQTDSLILVDEKNTRYLALSEATDSEYTPTTLQEKDWEYLDILQGLVTIYPETQGLFIPQMLNYDQFGAISFTKGCFVGQEIVARTQHLGKLKRHLHLLEKDTALERGAELLDEQNQNCGTVVACSLNPEGKYSVLAVLKDN